MALVIGDNFSFQGAKPLDGRLKYDTLANMKAVGDSTMYDGCLAYCVATDKTYQWKSTNTVDTDLGKWREFSSGGGGGHAIEDSEGTALTQRETMQFGEGFLAEDDAENEKTVISPDVMQSGDMSDVITLLPSVTPKKEGIKYSTTEQVVGEWIDSKPIYQKTFDIDLSSMTQPSSTRGNVTLLTIPNCNMDMVFEHECFFYNKDSNTRSIMYLSSFIDANGEYVCGWIDLDNNTFIYKVMMEGGNWIRSIIGKAGCKAYLTIRYTKTTDTPNT